MSETPTASDWAAARGEKWRAQLSPLEAMLTAVDAPLIDALQLDAPYKIADIGCGGGGTTLAIARRAEAGSEVHGFDISPALIEAARDRAADERAIAFSCADMGTAPAPEVPYDRLVSRFGIMFYDDPPAAFARIARWLKPGGRFAFAVWGPPSDNPWMASLREVAAGIIDVPPPDPEAPGPFRYAGADKLLALLDQAGLGGLAVADWRGRLPIGGGLPAPEAADFALASFSVGELASEAGDSAYAAVRDALAAHFARHMEDGVVRLDARVHIVTGAAS
ncbi:methyltransferase type 11 [Methyloceanibacter superfactus]|uniref:Methyltransferase type 11 n=1 Tax=Methyloceanibacter superfactus TaxID=1774969 RepID=A0A1E3W7I4_9HYPH|nr:class I SAM-dependent methyltransferase [Methyloceanibacter superfactus]ODS01795.1 methyltransferase type 11 [Methyloceanibacter superfactus]